MKKCTCKPCKCKRCKWIIAIAFIGLILVCFIFSKLMGVTHTHSDGQVIHSGHHDGRRRRGGWGWGPAVDEELVLYDDAPIVYEEPVVRAPGLSVGIGVGGYYGPGYYRYGRYYR